MSDNVFDKLDALLKKHAANEPEIPVLTDLVQPPRIDLNAIPVLTEEITARDFTAPMELELDLIPEPMRIDPAIKQAEAETVLAQLNAVEAELQAEVDARIAQVQNEATPALELEPAPAPEPEPEPMEGAPEIPKEIPQEVRPALPLDSPPFSMEIPLHAKYVPLPHTVMEIPVLAADTQTAPLALSDEALRSIATLIEIEVARLLKDSLRQTLSAELSGMLNITLDKALSSMLDQHMMMLEETVRSTIADEFQKQLAPFKRPPPNKS